MPLNSEVFYSRIWCLKYLSSSSLRWNRIQVLKELLALKMEGGSGNILAGSESLRLKCQDSDETQRNLIYTPSHWISKFNCPVQFPSESFVRYKPTSSEDHLDPEKDTTGSSRISYEVSMNAISSDQTSFVIVRTNGIALAHLRVFKDQILSFSLIWMGWPIPGGWEGRGGRCRYGLFPFILFKLSYLRNISQIPDADQHKNQAEPDRNLNVPTTGQMIIKSNNRHLAYGFRSTPAVEHIHFILPPLTGLSWLLRRLSFSNSENSRIYTVVIDIDLEIQIYSLLLKLCSMQTAALTVYLSRLFRSA